MHKFFNVLLALTVISNACDVHALKCHECSSLDNKECGDLFLATNTLIECPLASDYVKQISNKTVPILCRKLIQTVEDKVRITRSCGYITDTTRKSTKSCYRKAFSGFSSSVFCDCAEDQCNTGNGVTTNVLLILATICIAVKFCFN